MEPRARNFWGWGYADRFPDDDARRTLGTFVANLLGFPEPTPLPPPRLDDVHLPPPRLAPPPELAAFCSAHRHARVTHTYGRSFRDLVRGFAGDFHPAPDFVALARDEADVVALLAWASREGVAVVPYGGGTSVVGGVEAPLGEGYRGAVSLDLRAMDRVLEVDPVSRAARIQAGATGPRIEAQLAEHGLTLRHFPQSFEFSTLGGWLATRAGGHFATLYTHIDDRVESIRMLTPAGPFESRRLPGSGAGPSPDRLVLGSEGILGVITEAWMRVHPRPRYRTSSSVHFADFATAVAAARRIAQAGLYPANCRLLDAQEAALNRVVDDGHHVLLLGFESADHPLDAWMAHALALCEGATCTHGPVSREGDAAGARARDAGTWREAFVNAPYLQTTLVSLGLVVDTFETACTWDRFDALHAAVTTAVTGAMQRACGAGRITCRFTHVYPDGPAPYYTFIAPGRAGEQLAQWEAIKRAASDALLAHGGTITHHHAVGRVHRPWYDRQRPALFARALRAAKNAMDPAWILNPGVLIDREE
jgi:alkyldihydroxyacetonephosphate synthase